MLQPCLMTERLQFLSFPALQNRKCSILTKQTIMQKQPANRGVKEICQRISLQVDHKNATCGRGPFHAGSAQRFGRRSDGASMTELQSRTNCPRTEAAIRLLERTRFRETRWIRPALLAPSLQS